MLDAFLTFLNENTGGASPQKTLLALSGGVDSMVMAELFRRAKVPVAVAHCNFGLRGAESDGDEDFVQKWAERNDAVFHVNKFDTETKAKASGVSTQMAARDLRYGWLEELLRDHGYEYLATAHHADDNIETVLLNLTRGTGLPGLLGIAPVKGCLIRPLLDFSKKEILDFAQKEKIPWREDSSNASDSYRRNRLRHQVLPVLWEINPSLKSTFNQNIERLRAANSLIGRQLADWQQRVVRQKGTCNYLSIQEIRQADEPVFVLHSVLEKYGFNYPQTRQIVASLDGISGKQFYSATHVVLKDRDELIIEPLRKVPDFEAVQINADAEKVALPGNADLLTKRISPNRELDFAADARTAYFDAAKLRFPLRVRPWQPGDWLCPFGMGGKRKKVSDLLVGAKVPLTRKNDWLVLLDDEGKLLWVIGLRTDERCRVEAGTAEILRVEYRTA